MLTLEIAGEVAEIAGFSATVAVSVSPLSAFVNLRLLKLAAPSVVETLMVYEPFRSASASLIAIVPGPAVNNVPLSVSVTTGAGFSAAPVVPLDGGWVVKLMA